MRKFKIVILGFILGFIFIPLALAHPPSRIELKFDPKVQELSIEIKHVSRDVRKHHIRKLQVFLNNENILDLTIAQQERNTGLSYHLPVKAKTGDEIKVKAICSEAGFKEETLVVP